MIAALKLVLKALLKYLINESLLRRQDDACVVATKHRLVITSKKF